MKYRITVEVGEHDLADDLVEELLDVICYQIDQTELVGVPVSYDTETVAEVV